jgi:hypothetical protein
LSSRRIAKKRNRKGTSAATRKPAIERFRHGLHQKSGDPAHVHLHWNDKKAREVAFLTLVAEPQNVQPAA